MAESDTIPQMREQIEKLQADIKKQQDTASELSKENRLLKARDVFRQQGYDPVHGELFATSTEGEITAEAVDGFASKYGLVPTSSADESPADVEASADDQSDSLSSFSRAGSGPGSGAAAGPTDNTLTRPEWIELQKSNPAAAKEAVAAGRVQLRADNPWL